MESLPPKNHPTVHLTPAQKLRLTAQLYQTAWRLKQAGLQMAHPEWPALQIAAELKRIFRYART